MEIVVQDDEGNEDQLAYTSKVICPRKGEYVWIQEDEIINKYGSSSFIVENVCHHISPNCKNSYDSIVIYVIPLDEYLKSKKNRIKRFFKKGM